MGNFNDTQIDRLALESKIRVLARQCVDSNDQESKQMIDSNVRVLIQEYPTQVPDEQRHLTRYESIKTHYGRGKRYEKM
jgi:hypothetical protein